MKPLFALVLALSSCMPPAATVVDDGAALLDSAMDATVVLAHREGEEGDPSLHCSGVIVGPTILTANHCVAGLEGNLLVELREDPGHPMVATVLARDGENDLAVLQVAGLLPPGLQIALAEPRYLDPLWIVGHPYGLRWTVTRAYVAFPRRASDDAQGLVRDWMQVHGAIDPGNSGGPVLDRYGTVVGIVSFHAGAQGGVVHLSALRRLYESLAPAGH